ncbi:MAG: type II toxin-antitoxin system RelE/ParE family toxin [Candidatus Sulfotelmatobacter sp.]
MPAYVLSPDALQDLQNIWDFIASDNAAAADKLENEFFEAFEMLAERPRMGHTRSDLTERDVRFWPIGSYLVVYRSIPAALEIVAVLHGARDVAEVIRTR